MGRFIAEVAEVPQRSRRGPGSVESGEDGERGFYRRERGVRRDKRGIADGSRTQGRKEREGKSGGGEEEGTWEGEDA